jgi:hypothetical protein
MTVYKSTDKNKKTTDGRYASPIKKSPPKIQKYKYGKEYKKSTDGRYASTAEKTTDGRYARPRNPDNRSYKNAVNLGQRIKVQKKRLKTKK